MLKIFVFDTSRKVCLYLFLLLGTPLKNFQSVECKMGSMKREIGDYKKEIGHDLNTCTSFTEIPRETIQLIQLFCDPESIKNEETR